MFSSRRQGLSVRPQARERRRRLFLESLEARRVLSTIISGVGRGADDFSVEGEILISAHVGLSQDVIADLGNEISELQSYDGAHAGIEGELQLISVPADERDAYIERLSADPRVRFVEPNYEVSTDLIPNDPNFDSLWGLNNTGQTGGIADADIDAVEAWNLAAGTRQTVVGVVDTGVDYTHPDLYLNIWLNQGEIPDFAGQRPIDTDGDGLVTFYDLNASENAALVTDFNVNGYIDGGDLLADPRWADNVDGPDPGGRIDDLIGWDFANNDNDPFDDQGHGTHVSGTIGAVGNNNRGVVGVNWRTQIMGLKFLGASGAGTTADAISAIQYATQQQATLTNNSWGGGGFSSALQNAIAASGEADMLFVAAAGNDGIDTDFVSHYPSTYQLPNIIAVAATDHNDSLASFSNFGATSVDLGAPGVSVVSTTPNRSYSRLSGTSMASPHVAGTAALAWSVQPDASFEEVRDAIYEGVDEVVGLGGTTATGGRLNALRAIQNVNPNGGTILFSQNAYQFPGFAEVAVFDTDPDVNPNVPDTVTVTVSSTSETTPETITLTETGPSTQRFVGTVALISASPVAGDGQLHVVHGDVLTASYEDANPGNGPGVISVTAFVDNQRPVIDLVQAVPGARQATVLWTTDEPANSFVRYGIDPNNLDQLASDSAFVDSHRVRLFGLEDETTYYFEAISADPAGNTTTSERGSFVTTTAPPILFVDDDQGDTLERFFTAALDAGGYVYGNWDVADLGRSPTVGDLADHATVIWNTGANYDAPTAGLTPAEEAEIRDFLDGGGNLFLVGQDVIYNGVSSSFLSEYLHVSAFIEDVLLERVVGAAGDPIGDGVDTRLDPPPPFETDFADLLQAGPGAYASMFTAEADGRPSDVAVRYPIEGPSPFKTVFFSFPFESISTTAADPNNQAAIMERVLTWLGHEAPGRPGVTIEPRLGIQTSERGDSDDFTVVLKTPPTADVLITFSGDSTEGLLTDGTADPAEDLTLTFTPENWETPQTITVIGVDDDLPDGNLSYLIATNPVRSDDLIYAGFDPIDVAVTNQEDAPFVEQGVLSGVGSVDWTTVTLDRTFDSLVVVATPQYGADDPAGVVRVRNAEGNQFEVRVESPTGLPIAGASVHYMALEEGVYTAGEHGVTMEARKFISSVTDGPGAQNGSHPDIAWVGEPQSYTNVYEQPVVLGQVMTYNDPRWSVFWSRSETSAGEAPSETIRVGKHVGEDPEVTRAAETIGYVVLDAGTGSLGGFEYVAAIGPATVAGVGSQPPYTYALAGLSSAGTAIASQSGMIGWDGGWAVLYGNESVTSTSLNLAIDEDENDGERAHVGERVSYIVFEREPNEPPILDLDANNSSGAIGANYSTLLRSKLNTVAATDDDAQITDSSSDHLFSLIATIANVRDGDQEFLSADVTGTNITAAYNPETGELALTGLDTPANYQRVLRTVTYTNNAEDRNPATRTISFVVNDGSLQSNTAFTAITFPPPNQVPIAHPGGPYAITIGGSVLLNAFQSTDPDAGPLPLTFQWDVNYEDGVFEPNVSGRNPSVTWGELQQFGIEAGESYVVAVRAFDGEDATIATTTLTVAPNQPPVVNTGGPYSIQPGWTLLLNSIGSFDPERGPLYLQVDWDVDFDGEFKSDASGSTVPLSWSRLQQLGVKPGGKYPIAVRVSDGTEVTVAMTQVSVSGNQPPVPVTGGPYTLQPGWTLFLRGQNSFDPDFGPSTLSYEWDINYDGEFKQDATGPMVTMNWGTLQQFGVEAGKSHRIALRLSDGADTSLVTTTLTVAGGTALALLPGESFADDSSDAATVTERVGPAVYSVPTLWSSVFTTQTPPPPQPDSPPSTDDDSDGIQAVDELLQDEDDWLS